MNARRLLTLTALAGMVIAPSAAAADRPPGPPGPPPGNGDLPAPPGTAPAFVPAGTPAAVPGAAGGPGLLSGAGVALDRARRTFSLRLACQANGTVSVTAPAVTKATLAQSRYHCSGARATTRLGVSSRVTRLLVRHRAVAATATVHQAGKASKLYFTLTAQRSPLPAKGFWTDGHLQCSDGAGAPHAYLVEPDFTTATPTPISTRGWVAWYTRGGGWHWLGVGGENASRWDTWTASVGGVVQFHPDGAPIPVPWTWGPISVPTGQRIHAIGVYEIVYWVAGRRDYQWQYVNAGTTGAAAAGGGNLYCSY
jgi:hypothetical protein